ncbi:MAG TPA: carboxylesterase/lipase family protein [Pyrinomonadaceae bacterium]|nr:carboxylesterase/lipase family protein [Pyrinomonadaceae bacterium]
MKVVKALFLVITLLSTTAVILAADLVQTANGTVEGRGVQPTGVRIFRGIPFAQPPTGELRWREPQPVKNWKGVRKALDFGPRCMQAPIFSDMVFRSNGVSEDCLYLNVWTPAKSSRERLPVLVYFYGGGFVAGDGSEPRYDGESMAAKGIVVVTLSYRLGVFGFMAHPELTKESTHKASGNYGLLDQNAALRWVQRNIANFGGDPKHVTIAGESAGSMSVSAHVVSPLSKSLIAGAIGESGAMLGALSAAPFAKAEEGGSKFAESLGAQSIAALRAIPSQQILDAASKGGWSSVGRFPLTVDGYFLNADPATTYATGKQTHVPLLVGWNSEESGWNAVLGREQPTFENYKKVLAKLYPDRDDEVLKLYPAATNEEVIQAATDLASDRFMGHSTWKWADLHAKTSGTAVYRYFYTRPRPPMRTQNTPPARGASHSAEIEYAMGNLKLMNEVYPWTEDDYKVSNVMQGYFANFIKKGDPNGPGLPQWPAISRGRVMRLDVEPRAVMDNTRARYLFLDQLTSR